MDIMNPEMLDGMIDGAKSPFGFAKFFKGLFAVCALMAGTAELAWDGDLSSPKTPAQAAAKECVSQFRAHPLKGSFVVDVSATMTLFEGIDANTATRTLRDDGYKVEDATLLYAGQLVENDRVLYGTRKASHVWPEFLRQDSCQVTLFMKDGKVTGAFARAVRVNREWFKVPQVPLPQVPFLKLPFVNS